jgi:hypothetical protein
MPTASSTVIPFKLDIGTLFEQRFPCYVPRYQRSYAWDEDEIADFVADIRELVERRRDNPGAASFFGGIVVIQVQQPERAARAERYEIVDGQQRLCTFTMAIALLADAFQELADDLSRRRRVPREAAAARSWAQELKEDYLYFKEVDDHGNRVSRPRLELSRTDQAFFSGLLEGSCLKASPRASNKLLEKAYGALRDDLILPATRATRVAERLGRLMEVKGALLAGAYVVQMVATDRTEGYELFSVLNDRGERLSAGDLLRSSTLQALEGHEKLQESAAEYWDDILNPSASDVDAFLRAYYPSITGERAHKSAMHGDYLRYFRGVTGTGTASGNARRWELTAPEAKRLVGELKLMREESDRFSKLVSGVWPYTRSRVPLWDRTRLERLIGTLKHGLCLPLLLASSAELAEADFARLVHTIERFAFRFKTVCNGHAGVASEAYYETAMAIRKGSYSFDVLVKKLRRLQDGSAGPEQFRSDLPTRLDYSKGAQRPNIRYLLTTIEDYHAWLSSGGVGNAKPSKSKVHDLGQIDVEHVYPRSARPRVKALEGLKDTIGNLAFWGPEDNRPASNAPFRQKRTRYSKSVIQMTRDLASAPSWGAARVRERQDRLVEQALRVFTI